MQLTQADTDCKVRLCDEILFEPIYLTFAKMFLMENQPVNAFTIESLSIYLETRKAKIHKLVREGKVQ